MVKYGYGELLKYDFHKVLAYQDMYIEDLKVKNGT